MRQDIRNMNYIFNKDREDKDLIYKIDLFLYQQMENYFVDAKNDIEKANISILEDRDGIIDNVVVSLLESETIDDYKLYYLVDSEFMKQLNKCKKYYYDYYKKKNNVKEKELNDMLKDYFEYCFDNCRQAQVKDILRSMSTSEFREATIEDLGIKRKDYVDFDKSFNKALNNFKTIHKNDYDKIVEQDGGIGFGWKLYAITKIFEGLFKI